MPNYIVNKIISKIKLNLGLLRNPLLINAYLYGQDTEIKHENWGDDINWFFLKEIIKRPISIYNRISIAMRLNFKNYLVIGSTIDLLCSKNTEVWGAGIIDGTRPLRIKPKKIHAVRGPLTRNALLNQGIQCPEIYGDPALLIPFYYQPKVKKKYKYGIVPHCSNVNKVINMTLDGKTLSETKDVLIIDLSKYKNWKDIPDQICSCENIISGSLHGLIIAEAYKIPNVWVEFGKPLIGGHFKFHDFFQSINRDRDMPLTIHEDFSTTELNKRLSKWQSGIINIHPLVKAAPFPIEPMPFATF